MNLLKSHGASHHKDWSRCSGPDNVNSLALFVLFGAKRLKNVFIHSFSDFVIVDLINFI